MLPHAPNHRDRGFSFIELLAYMAIAALLVLAAVPQFGNYREKAAITNLMGDLRDAASAMEASWGDAQAYPATLPTSARASAGGTLTVARASDATYCLDGVSAKADGAWHFSPEAGLERGSCAQVGYGASIQSVFQPHCRTPESLAAAATYAGYLRGPEVRRAVLATAAVLDSSEATRAALTAESRTASKAALDAKAVMTRATQGQALGGRELVATVAEPIDWMTQNASTLSTSYAPGQGKALEAAFWARANSIDTNIMLACQRQG